jgi:hypothetical protein
MHIVANVPYGFTCFLGENVNLLPVEPALTDDCPVLSDRGTNRPKCGLIIFFMETGKNGGYAAFASNVSCIPGYQRDSVERHSLFKTRVRTCSKRWAPGSVHRICCFFTIRLLTT